LLDRCEATGSRGEARDGSRRRARGTRVSGFALGTRARRLASATDGGPRLANGSPSSNRCRKIGLSRVGSTRPGTAESISHRAHRILHLSAAALAAVRRRKPRFFSGGDPACERESGIPSVARRGASRCDRSRQQEGRCSSARRPIPPQFFDVFGSTEASEFRILPLNQVQHQTSYGFVGPNLGRARPSRPGEASKCRHSSCTTSDARLPTRTPLGSRRPGQRRALDHRGNRHQRILRDRDVVQRVVTCCRTPLVDSPDRRQ